MNDANLDEISYFWTDNSRMQLGLAGLRHHSHELVNQTTNVCCPVCSAVPHIHPDINLASCHRCEHVFQTDLAITAVYDAAYAHKYDAYPARELSAVRWEFIKSALVLPSGSRVLDVGYGNGAFLKHAQDVGMDIYGIDVHTEDFGVPVISFDTQISFDLICFFDSLEHFSSFDPIIALRSKNVIVSIPHRPPTLISNPSAWRHYRPGEHLHYFSPTSLDTFMAYWGFTRRVIEGFPEDALRGKLMLDGQKADNIYSAIYTHR